MDCRVKPGNDDGRGGRLHSSQELGFVRNAAPPIHPRHPRHPRAGLAHQREPPRGELAPSRHRAWRHPRPCGRHAQGAEGRGGVRADHRGGRCHRHRDQSRHGVRVRLCRRRAVAVRSQGTDRHLHSRLSGAARRAGDERAVVAVVLLGHHAADRARLFAGARKDARRRRRGRLVDGGQYFRRPGRGAAVHPALPRETVARRNVRGDDRRHGRHRGHRVRALCDDPCQRHPRCRRPYRGLLSARRAGGDPDQLHHGARSEGSGRPAARSAKSNRSPQAPWTPSSKALARGSSFC